MKKVVIAAIAVVIIAAGIFGLAKKSDNKKTTDLSTNTTSQTQSTTPPASSDQNAAATITYADSGFSPSKITVKSGSTVTIKNTSSGEMQLDSDPHPIHTDDTDLNVGAVAAGQSQTFTVTKKGTFGYHNHLNPSDKGTIIVE